MRAGGHIEFGHNQTHSSVVATRRRDDEGIGGLVRNDLQLAFEQLRSMTGGRGTFEMEFSHYETVPAHIAQKVVAEAQAAKKAQQEA